MQRFARKGCQTFKSAKMKKSLFTLAYIPALLAGLLCYLPSCKKSKNDPTPLQATIRQNSSYQHNFGLIGIEDGMSITRPAEHARTSTLVRNTSTGELIYTYIPVAGFVGTDHVVFTTSISDGANVVNTAITTIQLTIIK
jgi:hypothetical protein